MKTLTLRLKGGKGSGHFNHRGRPGKQGGGLPDNSSSVLTSDQMNSWAMNIAQSDLMSNLYKYAYRREELESILQEFPYSRRSKEEFVSYLKQLMTDDENLPKPKKPSDGWWNWVSRGTMTPEVMWYLREHFRKHGSGSQLISLSEFREYSKGELTETAIDKLYSDGMRNYFQWERMGGLNQLRLKNDYKFSENGISTKAQIIYDQMKSINMTPEKLYNELMKTRPMD
jgi:hypothetical protein